MEQASLSSWDSGGGGENVDAMVEFNKVGNFGCGVNSIDWLIGHLFW